MKLSIVKRETLASEIWDNFVERSSQGWFWHLSTFIDAFDTWDGYDDISFGIIDEMNNQELVAIVQLSLVVLQKRTQKRSLSDAIEDYLKKISKSLINVILKSTKFNTTGKHTFLYSLGGYAIKNDLTEKQNKNILEELELQIKNLIKRHNALKAEIHLPALAPAYLPGVCPSVNPLLFIGCENTSSQTWVIDLQKKTEQIFKSYSQKTRQHINNASAQNMLVREAMGEEDFQIYYQLHCETYDRTGAKPHNVEYFHKIFTDVVNKGLCKIHFLEKEGKVIAALNSVFYKNVGMSWTAASVNEKDDGINKYLWHKQIVIAKEMGSLYYEVGEAFPHIREGKLKGLNDFKRSFGCFIHPIYEGTLRG